MSALEPYAEWEQGVLYCGDCLEILPKINGGGASATVTDPPYGVDFKYESHDDTPVGYEDWCRRWFLHLERISHSIFMSCGIVNVGMWTAIRPVKWIAAWIKPAAMGRSPFGFCNWEPMLLWGTCSRDTVDVFSAGILPDSSLDGHPCPKPLLWGTQSVERVSKEGDTILDPFLGSGTVAVACVRTGRRFIGIEKEKKYCEIAKSRIDDDLANGMYKSKRPAVIVGQKSIFE